MDQFDFHGKKLIVTGGSSGVGRATAVLLSRTGAQITIIARREEALRETLAQMEGEGHQYITADLSDFDQAVSTIQQIVQSDGKKLDGVAHCAGIALPVPLRAMSAENIRAVFATNFNSFAAILKCVASKRLFNDHSSVVTVSSASAAYGQAGNGIYAASKGAMDSLMKSAAKELRPRGIRVNSICSSAIRTEMMASLTLKDWSSNVEELPDSFLAPEQVASIIAALLSGAMGAVSGVALDVDAAHAEV